MAQQDNWLAEWINKAVGPKKKHKPFHDDGMDGQYGPVDGTGNLFKEINQLRKPDLDPNDQDAIERAKYSDGFFGHIAGSKKFEFSTLGMICFNALMIGVDADYSARFGKPDNLNEGPIFFIVIENIFATYFTSEVVIRFVAYKKKADCLCDAWFMFDSCLVTMMVIETWVLPFLGSGGPLAQLSILRLLRLLRITRMARLMRAVPEMMVIIKGMVAATRTVVCTGALLVLVLYTFCILFTDAYHEPLGHIDLSDDETDQEAMFGTMGKSMFSLFIMGTVLDDVTAASNVIRESGNFWMLSAFVCFILISSFMMLNMLIGVLVEVVGATAQGEREKTVETNVREAIAQIFSTIDKNSNGEISRSEFLDMRRDKKVMEALSELDIDGTHFHLYAQLFFRPTEENGGSVPSLSYDKLVSMILRLRPGSFVSALDFAAFSKGISGIHDRVKDRVVNLEKMCEGLAEPGDELFTVAPRPEASTTGNTLALPGELPGSPDQKSMGAGPSPINSVDDTVQAFVSGPPSPGFRVAQPLANLDPNVLGEFDGERLERTASADIIEELQRRLGMADLDKTGVPYSMMDEELQSRLRQASEQGVEAFMTLGVPQDDDTVYV